jgi:hypothetical protein
MQSNPALTSFRILVENCLKQACQAHDSQSEPPSEPEGFLQPAIPKNNIRTEINLRVIENFLKP